MSHSWKKRKHLYTNYVKEDKNKRSYYVLYHKFCFCYRPIHRAAAACTHDSETPGIRPRLLPPDPWEDIPKHRTAYLKPLKHSRLERHRAARKAAIREMDARLSSLAHCA